MSTLFITPVQPLPCVAVKVGVKWKEAKSRKKHDLVKVWFDSTIFLSTTDINQMYTNDGLLLTKL